MRWALGVWVMQVCVVEDNATNLAVLVGLVSRLRDVTVEGFPDPVIALDACRRTRVDLVLVFAHGLRADVLGAGVVQHRAGGWHRCG